MRILYVNHTSRPSGAGISLGLLVRNMPPEVEKSFMLRPGCEVTDLLGATEDRTQWMKYMPEAMTNTYTHRLPPLKDWWQFAKLAPCFLETRRAVSRFSPEILHLNETTLLGHALAGHLLGKPVVIHARTALNDLQRERRMLEAISRWRNVRFAAIDEEVRDSLPPGCQEKTVVIPNPVESKPKPPAEKIQELRRAWGLPEGAILCGQVASLHPEKGIWTILDIATKLCARDPKIFFVLVGDDREEAGLGPQLKKAVSERGLQGRVIFAGYRKDLEVVYAAIDIVLCLFGAALAGVGRTVYEAAMHARPVVATLPDPRTGKTLVNSVNALVFRPDDQAGIEAGISALADAPERRRQLGETLREQVARKHFPENSVRAVMELYRDLLA